MFYYTVPTLANSTDNAFLYFFPNSFTAPFPGRNYCFAPQTIAYASNWLSLQTQPESTLPTFKKIQHSTSMKTQTSESIEGQEIQSEEKVMSKGSSNNFRKMQNPRPVEIKLDFRIQWNNENRNVVPNLVNQMMSFLFKKHKSSKLINRLFQIYSHPNKWTPEKFYQYMKKIKDSVCHYVNESVIKHFFQIHEPKCEIYSEEEQQFYMKLCRIAVLSFLRGDAVVVSLTSSRMSKYKRAAHLIAREAILQKFLQFAHL